MYTLCEWTVEEKRPKECGREGWAERKKRNGGCRGSQRQQRDGVGRTSEQC
jgi:hypothetical protein